MSRTRVLTLLSAITASLLVSRAINAQQAAAPTRDGRVATVVSGTGVIGGRVVSDEPTPRPLRLATVMVRDVERGNSRAAVTGDDGRFVVTALPAGRFLISVAKATYVSMLYGARSPKGQGVPVALEDGQRLDTIDVRLPRGAVITGRVLDERGRPLPRQPVFAAERIDVGATVTYRGWGTSGGQTDDRGVFRIYGLPAGRFIIATSNFGGSASAPRMPTMAEVQWALGKTASSPGAAAPPPPAQGPGLRLTNVYYPGVVDPEQATMITVAAGEERAGVELTMRYVPAATVQGVVARVDGQPPRGVQVVPVSMAGRPSGLGIPDLPPIVSVSPDGAFSIGGLTPGRYLLTARAPSVPSGPPVPGVSTTAPVSDLWARAELTITGTDVSGVVLTLTPGVRVTGRVVFETAAQAAPDANSVYVSLAAPPGSGPTLGVPQMQPDASGAFIFSGVAPGAYLLSAGLRAASPSVTPGWMLKSATSRGADILDSPLDVQPGVDVSDVVVTFTDRVTRLSGAITDQAGRPVTAFAVIAFATDSKYWRQDSRRVPRPVQPSSDGRFVLNGLPPGEYYLAILNEAPTSQWFAPAFLDSVVPGAIRVTLSEGEQKTQDVRLAVQ